MESYLRQHPRAVYFDATGVLPRNTQIFAFPSPTSSGSAVTIDQILTRKDLDLVFVGNRLFYFAEPVFNRLRELAFIQIGNGVFAKAEYPCTRPLRRKEHRYIGDHFMRTRPAQPGEEPTRDELLICTSFAPLKFPGGKAFARIFDYN